MKTKFLFLLIIIFSISLGSCTLEKRVHRKGYHVELIKKHSFEFDYNSIYLDFANEFHHNGFFVDMELSESEISQYKNEGYIKNDILFINSYQTEVPVGKID